MSFWDLDAITVELTLLVGAVAALAVAVIIGVRRIWHELVETRRLAAKVKHEVSHNGGSSLKDSAARTEDATARILGQLDTLQGTVNAQGEMVRSQGHQLGEIRDDARIIHEDHAERLRRIEKRL